MAENKVTLSIEVEGDAQAKIAKIMSALEDLGTDGEKQVKKLAGAWDVFTGALAANLVADAIKGATSAFINFADTLIRDGVQAAIEQENAINRLNQALLSSGQYSQETSKDMQAFAAAMQETTTAADETVLETSALIESLGHLDKEALKQATKAALDMSAALGIDLRTAAMAVGKAAAGEVSGLSRYGVVVQEGATRAESFSNALKALNRSFGGRAAAEVQTFAGGIAQLKNMFGEIEESVGNTIIKNQSLINVFGEVSKILKEVAGSVDGNKTEFAEFVSQGIITAIDALYVLAKVVDVVARGFKILIEGLTFAITGSATVFASFAGLISKEWQTTADVMGNAARNSAKAISDAFTKESAIDKLEPMLERIRSGAQAGFGKIVENTDRIPDSANRATQAVQALSDAQQKLVDQGVQIAQRSAETDPNVKYQNEVVALQAALDAQRISFEQYYDSAWQLELERRDKMAEMRVEEADLLLAENERAIAEDAFKNQQLIAQNNQRVQQIIATEQLTAKQKNQIQTQAAQQSEKIEKLRAEAIRDSLGQLSSLQHAKTKEIAAVGKAAAIAQTTIDTYKGAQAAASALAGIPVVGPGLAVAAAAAFVAAGLARVAMIAGVPLAEGMTEVPAGFNNDTFPARLSSGERVVDRGTNEDLKAFLSGSGGMTAILAQILQRMDSLEHRVEVHVGSRVIFDEVREGYRQGRLIEV